jgi:NADP-dependent 3-hydroxy acid dehydrogenase YdfG
MDKVVVITGASSGIGEATGRLLAREGARVLLGARREERLKKIVDDLKSAGLVAASRTVDVTRRDEVEGFVKAGKELFGRVDVLVNNAGVMPGAPLAARRVEEWDRMIDVNLRGVLHGIAAALPLMLAQDEGHIINLSSVAGHVVFPGFSVYSATKFAVRAVSEGLRKEMASRGIRVTVISPGAVRTELVGTISDEQIKKQVNQLYEIAIEPDAVARAISYAIEQPPDVDINEVILRPTRQEM